MRRPAKKGASPKSPKGTTKRAGAPAWWIQWWPWVTAGLFIVLALGGATVWLVLEPDANGSTPNRDDAGAASNQDDSLIPDTLENRRPDAPENPTPSNGAPKVAYSGLELRWMGGDPDGDAVTYTVEYSLEAFESDLIDVDAYPATPTGGVACMDDANTACVVEAIVPEATYHWRVEATDEAGAASLGPTWTFTTAGVGENLPPVFQDDYEPVPLSNTVQVGQLTLSWRAVDPEGDPVEYQVYYGTAPNPSTPACAWTTQSTCTVTADAEGATYHWRVEARDASNPVVGSHALEFTTEQDEEPPQGNALPDSPANPSPPHQALDEPVSGVTLSWAGTDPDPGPGALEYQVLFGTTNPPVDVLCPWQSDSTCHTGTLQSGTPYYWQVVARDDDDASRTVASSIWNFQTEDYDPPENGCGLPACPGLNG